MAYFPGFSYPQSASPPLRHRAPANSATPASPSVVQSRFHLAVILRTAIPILLWLLGKSYPLLAAVLSTIWEAVKPKPAPTATPLPDLQGLLDRLSKLEQQQVQK